MQGSVSPRGRAETSSPRRASTQRTSSPIPLPRGQPHSASQSPIYPGGAAAQRTLEAALLSPKSPTFKPATSPLSSRSSSPVRSPGGISRSQPQPSRMTPRRMATATAPSTENQEGTQSEELKWDWKWGSKIRYFKAGNSGPPLILIHGFGVGAWHFEHNVNTLANDYQVYAVDLLGQGSSWPDFNQGNGDDGALQLSVATWTDQIADFIRQVVGAPAFVAGNSLGGYVSVSLAANNPDLVKGLVLLNCTPFWSFRPGGNESQGLWNLLQFDGTGPVPENLRRTVEQLWWNNIRNRQTIESMLNMVYAHKPIVQGDRSIVDRIIEATEHPNALDSFVSIFAAPKNPQDFETLLTSVQCPISLVYGRQDPWVLPMYGQRAAQVLTNNGTPPAMYLELDNAGHCPHHEAPVATNAAMRTCLQYIERINAIKMDAMRTRSPAGSPGPDGQPSKASDKPAPWKSRRPLPPIQLGQKIPVQEHDGRTVTIEHVDGEPKHLVDKLGLAAWKMFESRNKSTPGINYKSTFAPGGASSPGGNGNGTRPASPVSTSYAATSVLSGQSSANTTSDASTNTAPQAATTSSVSEPDVAESSSTTFELPSSNVVPMATFPVAQRAVAGGVRFVPRAPCPSSNGADDCSELQPVDLSTASCGGVSSMPVPSWSGARA